MQGVTAELLKDIITIFYSPLAQVYKAASIADSLGDLQAFINDMIRTVEQVEERELQTSVVELTSVSQEDPQRTVQTFIDLVQRHEQAFYTFVHNVHSKGQGLFESLMGWIELFLSYARDGLPQPLDLEILLPHGGPERAAIMKEVDSVAQYHYKLKVAHEEKIRKRFQGGAGADEQTMEEAALVDSVMQSLSIGDTIMGSAGEIAVEESEESEDEEDDSYEERSDTSSIKSATTPRRGTTHGHSLLVPPENIKALDEKSERRRSGGFRSSLDAVRNKVRSDSNASDRPPPVPPKEKGGRPPPQPGPRRKRRRGRKVNEVLTPPETPHLNALRPLFVEVVKQLLVVKKLDATPPILPTRV